MPKFNIKNRIAFLRKQITNQRKWIEDCEANGVSYTDPEKGQKIKQADANALKQYETELAILTGNQ